MKPNVILPLIVLACVFLTYKPAVSYADWHHHDHFRFGLDLNFPIGGYDRYYYDPGYVYADPAVYQPVIVSGTTYYTYNGGYYTYTPYGYQLVTPPPAAAPAATVMPAPADPEESFSVNIPNDKGGYTAVTIKRSGNGFVGPQGEFYDQFPKISQLKAMYAK